MHYVQILEERQEERSVRLALQESRDASPTVATLLLPVVVSLVVSLCSLPTLRFCTFHVSLLPLVLSSFDSISTLITGEERSKPT